MDEAPFSDPVSIADVSKQTGILPGRILKLLLIEEAIVACRFEHIAVVWHSKQVSATYPAWRDPKNIQYLGGIEGAPQYFEADFSGWIFLPKRNADSIIANSAGPLENFASSGVVSGAPKHRRANGHGVSLDREQGGFGKLRDNHYFMQNPVARAENTFAARSVVDALAVREKWKWSPTPSTEVAAIGRAEPRTICGLVVTLLAVAEEAIRLEKQFGAPKAGGKGILQLFPRLNQLDRAGLSQQAVADVVAGVMADPKFGAGNSASTFRDGIRDAFAADKEIFNAMKFDIVKSKSDNVK